MSRRAFSGSQNIYYGPGTSPENLTPPMFTQVDDIMSKATVSPTASTSPSTVQGLDEEIIYVRAPVAIAVQLTDRNDALRLSLPKVMFEIPSTIRV